MGQGNLKSPKLAVSVMSGTLILWNLSYRRTYFLPILLNWGDGIFERCSKFCHILVFDMRSEVKTVSPPALPPETPAESGHLSPCNVMRPPVGHRRVRLDNCHATPHYQDLWTTMETTPFNQAA